MTLQPPRASGDHAERPGATRRRGQVLEQAILRAAADELAEVGYSGLTMDRVAARARTNKNAIYRRWPNRATLAVAAYRQLLPTNPDDIPDTGDLRLDALALLTRTNQRMSSPVGQVLRALMTGIQDDPDRLREVGGQLVDTGNRAWLTILGRAVDRGEARPEALHPRVATVAVNLLRTEYALSGVAEIPDEVIVDIVDRVYLPLVRADDDR